VFSRPRHPVTILSWLVLLAAGTAWAANPGAFNRTAAVDQSVESLRKAAGPGLRVERSTATGLVRFMSATKSRGVILAGAGSPDARALEFVDRYGPAFGLDRQSVRVQRMSVVDGAGMEHVRLQQIVAGIPVAGGEAIVHLRGSKVASVLARTVPDLDRVTTTPGIAADRASNAVRGLLAKHLGIDNADLSAPRLEIFNPSLLDGGAFRPSRLAWFVEARTFDRLEYVWVDAETGAILLDFNQMPHSRNRLVYDAGSESSLPGAEARIEGEGATGDADTNDAYDFSGDTYDYYSIQHNRDSYDDAGAALISTVHFCPETEAGSGIYDCPYANAFWNGSQMVYGEGFSSADDVVGHELTHAVTERTAGLYYYMQSGALNESFSDIFGETIDQTNGAGSDAPADRWLMGEDLPGGGPIRDMWDPNDFYQPEKMSDATYFWCNADDNGGVHFNSGLPNRAYALMVDGGSFNGFTITGIGLTKAAAIHYRVLTQYLVSGSDFKDHYDAANLACADLIGGSLGITAGDCTEVDEALRAVEMNAPWACLPAQSVDPELCSAGEDAVDLFFDPMDAPWQDRWSQVTWSPTDENCRWFEVSGYATSEPASLWGPARDRILVSAPEDPEEYTYCTIDIRQKYSIAIPPTGAKLRFNHSFGFEDFMDDFYDGGFIVYSTTGNFLDWHVADCSTCEGLAYNGSIITGTGNQMEGVTGFVADSFGYGVTQLDLSEFAGQNLQIGFRASADAYVSDEGWLVDDIRIFECVADGSDALFSDGFESGDPSSWSSMSGGP